MASLASGDSSPRVILDISTSSPVAGQNGLNPQQLPGGDLFVHVGSVEVNR